MMILLNDLNSCVHYFSIKSCVHICHSRDQTSADSTVRVSFLSGFSGKSCPVSVCCPDSVRIFCPVSVCPDSVCLESVRCPDSVRILRKKAVRCLSVRIFSTSILSAVGILSGFLENRLSGVCPSGLCSKIVCPVSVWILSVWTSIDLNTLSGYRNVSIRMWIQSLKTRTQTRTRRSERTLKKFESQIPTQVGIKSDSYIIKLLEIGKKLLLHSQQFQ